MARAKKSTKPEAKITLSLRITPEQHQAVEAFAKSESERTGYHITATGVLRTALFHFMESHESRLPDGNGDD